MRAGPKRSATAPSVRGKEVPNTAKLANQLVRVAKNRGCTLVYLLELVADEWVRDDERLEREQKARRERLNA